uniref:Methyltransferase domain-containing protein n=1 Tax=Desulfatirhabdium butyrativorans TaxID=340467 RepID=A0A7C4MP48_9BACT
MNAGGCTLDTLEGGKLRILQPERGYRFSVDALLLADFVRPTDGERILEIGAGCGVVSLLLAFHNPTLRIVSVEIQPQLAGLAARNAVMNGLETRMEVLCRDIRELSLRDIGTPADRVLTNPPFHKVGSGRINPRSQQALARHELTATIQDIVHAASRLLRKGGRFDLIYCPDRLTELMIAMTSADIEPKTMQFVHGNPGNPARMVLVSGVRGGRAGGLIVRPPMFVAEEKKEGAIGKAEIPFSGIDRKV